MPDSFSAEHRDRIGIASVMARKGADYGAIAAVLAIAMPTGPAATIGTTRVVVGTGPGTWLVIEDEAAPDFAETIEHALAGLASVSDQSSGYAVHRLSGAGARTILQRGAPVDLDPAAFGTGSAATTVIAHIGAILWQVDEHPTYDVAVFRSYATSFRHWLAQSRAAL